MHATWVGFDEKKGYSWHTGWKKFIFYYGSNLKVQ